MIEGTTTHNLERELDAIDAMFVQAVDVTAERGVLTLHGVGAATLAGTLGQA